MERHVAFRDFFQLTAYDSRRADQFCGKTFQCAANLVDARDMLVRVSRNARAAAYVFHPGPLRNQQVNGFADERLRYSEFARTHAFHDPPPRSQAALQSRVFELTSQMLLH